MRNIFLIPVLASILLTAVPLLSQAQTISCDDLQKIQITASNREVIIKKYKSAIYRCAGVTYADSLVLNLVTLDLLSKHASVSNVIPKTIGDLVREIQLVKTDPQYNDLREVMVFYAEYMTKKITIEDKQEVIGPLTILATVAGNEVIDPNLLINYVFSPACKGLTYQEGYQKFLAQYKPKK